jgi:hypothetical protein
MTHFNMNSGLFYLRANPRTVELMQRLETRLAREKYWDQTAYNEEMFVLSHGDYKSPQVGGKGAPVCVARARALAWAGWGVGVRIGWGSGAEGGWGAAGVCRRVGCAYT